MGDSKDRRIAELEAHVAKLEAEREETNQAAATRRAERLAERASKATREQALQSSSDESKAPPTTSPPPAQEQPAVGPLAGVRVVECTHFIAGPLSGRLLADQGVRQRLSIHLVTPSTGMPGTESVQLASTRIACMYS